MKNDSYLLESDVVRGFAETTAADVHVVLANHTMMIEASSATKNNSLVVISYKFTGYRIIQSWSKSRYPNGTLLNLV